MFENFSFLLSKFLSNSFFFSSSLSFLPFSVVTSFYTLCLLLALLFRSIHLFISFPFLFLSFPSLFFFPHFSFSLFHCLFSDESLTLVLTYDNLLSLSFCCFFFLFSFCLLLSFSDYKAFFLITGYTNTFQIKNE